MIENSRIKKYYNCSFFYTESFSKPGITCCFRVYEKTYPSYIMKFYFTSLTLFCFFSLLVDMRQCVSFRWLLKKTEQKQKIVTGISAHVWKMPISSLGLT